MKEWFRIACERSVRRRALRTVAVVGSILLAINHGDAILHGDVSAARWLRIALTLIVPYFVSTFSSVGALRDIRRSQETPAPRPVAVEKLDRLAS